MDRRDFLKITAASGASATLASCGNPEHSMVRFIPEEELSGGVAVWKPSICPLCPAGCGMLVRVMDGEAEVIRNGKKGTIQMGLAKKLEGNPNHPISQGKLCVRGQAAIQVTYHPDRIIHPLKRSGARGTGPFQEITWDEAMSMLVSQLNGLAASGNQKAAVFLTKPMRDQRQTLISEFSSRFGASVPVTFDPLGDHVLRRANARSFGYDQLPTFDIGRSRYVLSFGADFLGTWNSPVTQSIGYGDMRQGKLQDQPAKRGKFVQFEARMSQTGANADEWIPVNPGTEGVLALGLAHVIMKAGLRKPEAVGAAGSQIAGWPGLADYAPEEVEKRTGVKAERVKRIAKEFANNGPAIAIIGGSPLAHTNGMFGALAVNALNALIGNAGAGNGESPMGFMRQPKPNADQNRHFESFIADAAQNNERVKVLLLHEANPVYGSPPAWRVRETLSKIPFIASFGSFIDETSILADLILPDHSFLESWVDHIAESGDSGPVIGLAPPAMHALHQTRAMPDVLLDASRKLAKPLGPPMPWKSYEEMLKASVEAVDPSKDAWKSAQQLGGVMPPANVSLPAPQTTRGGSPLSYSEPQFDGDAGQFPFHFLPFQSQAFLDGSLAHLPWLQELPDVLTTAMWSSWVELNPQTAARLGIAAGDTIEVSSNHGNLQSPAVISPGIAPNIIAMPMGQGHETFTRFASGRGANPISILAPMTEPETGSLAWAATRVRVAKVQSPSKSKLILFAGSLREHPEDIGR